MFSISRVPLEPTRRKKWITAIEEYQEFDYTIINYFVCEKHFQPECIMRSIKTFLRPGSVPSIFESDSVKAKITTNKTDRSGSPIETDGEGVLNTYQDKSIQK